MKSVLILCLCFWLFGCRGEAPLTHSPSSSTSIRSGKTHPIPVISKPLPNPATTSPVGSASRVERNQSFGPGLTVVE